MRWLWIAVIVLFIVLAPKDATNVVHGLVAFIQGIFGSFNLH